MTDELVAPTTDGGDRQTAVEAGAYGPRRLDAGEISAVPDGIPTAGPPAGVAATASAGPRIAPSSAEPYSPAEFEALIEAVWSLEDTEDLVRFHELLHAALVYIGRIAFDPSTDPFDAMRAAVLLRSMEQRALWGPDHPVGQP